MVYLVQQYNEVQELLHCSWLARGDLPTVYCWLWRPVSDMSMYKATKMLTENTNFINPWDVMLTFLLWIDVNFTIFFKDCVCCVVMPCSAQYATVVILCMLCCYAVFSAVCNCDDIVYVVLICSVQRSVQQWWQCVHWITNRQWQNNLCRVCHTAFVLTELWWTLCLYYPPWTARPFGMDIKVLC